MKEWKASEKEAQKMTRDGAVSVNLVTGETTYPSDRTPEQDHSVSSDTADAAGKAVDCVELHHERKSEKRFMKNSGMPSLRSRTRYLRARSRWCLTRRKTACIPSRRLCWEHSANKGRTRVCLKIPA